MVHTDTSGTKRTTKLPLFCFLPGFRVCTSFGFSRSFHVGGLRARRILEGSLTGTSGVLEKMSAYLLVSPSLLCPFAMLQYPDVPLGWLEKCSEEVGFFFGSVPVTSSNVTLLN
jgi:hypothetical protein